MLKSCVQCGYSLKGLPGNHACPECGLRFDERSQVWRKGPGIVVFVGMLGYLGSIGALIQMPRAFGGFSNVIKAVVVLGVVVYVTSFLWLAWFCWRRFRQDDFVATLPDGVYSRIARFRPTLTPWSDISRVTAAPGHAAIVLKDKSVRNILGVFRGREEVVRFVAAVEARIRETSGDRSKEAT